LAFLRVVEVFPPMFPAEGGERRINLERSVDDFVDGVKGIKQYADLVLVASVKNPAFLKLSSVEAASILKERARVEAAPVIVARDSNRPQVLSSVVTALSLGLRSLMLVWGDRYPTDGAPKNVFDFPSLSKMVSLTSLIADRTRSRIRILAPVDLSLLGSERGVALARSRLEAGADLLLAQPPTTDSRATLAEHASVLEATGLKENVLLNVFPFRGRKDVSDTASNFGWRLPPELYKASLAGGAALTKESRRVASALRRDGFPGVYLATRGRPETAKEILG